MSKKPPKESLEQYINDKEAAAKEFGVTVRTIYRWMSSMGIIECKENYGRKLTKESAEEIRFGFSQGSSVKELAKKHSVTLAAVYRVINNVTHKGSESLSQDTAQISAIYKV